MRFLSTTLLNPRIPIVVSWSNKKKRKKKEKKTRKKTRKQAKRKGRQGWTLPSWRSVPMNRKDMTSSAPFVPNPVARSFRYTRLLQRRPLPLLFSPLAPRLHFRMPEIHWCPPFLLSLIWIGTMTRTRTRLCESCHRFLFRFVAIIIRHRRLRFLLDVLLPFPSRDRHQEEDAG